MKRSSKMAISAIQISIACFLVFPWSANASFIEVIFGTPVSTRNCNLSGDSGDSSCSVGYKGLSDDDDRLARIELYAQASAESSYFNKASASLLMQYRIPVAVRRAVTFHPQTDGSITVVVPQPRIKLSLELDGWLAFSPFITGEGVPYRADLYDSRVYVLSTDFMGGLDALSFTVDPSTSPSQYFNPYFRSGSGNNSYKMDKGSSVGEIGEEWDSALWGFHIWEDNFAPYFDYDRFALGGFFQDEIGYIDISTELFASSDDTLERIACYGLKSELDRFAMDSGCGDGYLRLEASVDNLFPPHTFTVMPASQTVPIPPVTWLLGTGLIGLLGINRRHKS